MSDEQTYPDINRDIESCYGVLNGDILTVAAKIVDPVTAKPIVGLTVNNVFNSGNHVPVGSIKVFNDVYDETTGFYWFDVKVKPIEHAADFSFETIAVLGKRKYPIRLALSVPGQSKAVVGKPYFTGTTVRYEVTGKPGTRILRYPLETITSVGAVAMTNHSRVATEGVTYLWTTNLKPGENREIRILGHVMIDDEVHTYVVRQTVKVPNVVASAITQLNGSQVGIKLVLDTPVGKGAEMMGVVQYVKAPELGKALIRATDLAVTNDTELYCEVSLWEIKQKGEVSFNMFFNLGDEINTPLPVTLQSEVKRFSNGQVNISLTEVTQTVSNNRHTLVYKANWENGEPVEGFSVVPDEEDTDVKIKGNHFFLTRPVKRDPDRAQEFTLSGKLSLSEYGIEEPVPYKGSRIVGSDLFPLKVPGTACSLMEDKASFIVALRANNGDLVDNVTVSSVIIEQGPFGTYVRESSYDADNGQLRFKLDATLAKLVYPYTDVVCRVNLAVTQGDIQELHEIRVSHKVKVDYKIYPAYIGTRFEKGPNGHKGIAQWLVVDNNMGAPKSASIISFKVNGKSTTFTKRYNQGTQILSAEFDIDVSPGKIVHVTGTVSASELNHFVTLTDATFVFYPPGSATLVNHMFNPDKTHLTVQWKMTGWSTELPGEVFVDDWLVLGGVNTQFLFTDYDAKTGILTCKFRVENPQSDRFSARTTCRIGKSDGNSYPLSFTILP